MTDPRPAPLQSVHPYPGLRSFTAQEAHLFFGREGQSNEIVRLLEAAGLAAVVGTSGCGKSSLVRAGLLPALLSGYAGGGSAKWQIADLRPGGDPLGALARALRETALGETVDVPALRSASAAVVQAVARAREDGRFEPDENLLLLVDQFEELFREEEGDQKEEDRVKQERLAAERDDKEQFVALLLAAVRRREARIFVVLTLRAEFLGECARYRDLPEAINRSQYLVPRMTRQQRRASIEGPARVAGAEIAPRLVQRLLNELGEDPDELPILQHALMRTWDRWGRRGRLTRAPDFSEYEAIGTLKNALDRHVDQAFQKASRRVGEGGKILVQRIFQRLRFRDDRGRERRSPAPVKALCEVTGASFDQVRTVVDVFRDDAAGRTFLTPFKSQVKEITPETEIDVVHESLLRRWTRLATGWVREEEDSRRLYVRLAQGAEEDAPSGNFLRGGLLRRAREWWNERQPTGAWAARYHPGFRAAKKFLEDSEAAEAQQREKESEARAKVEKAQRTRWYFFWIAAASLCGFALALCGYLLVQKAQKQAVAHLLASRAALASGEDGAGLETGLLLAAESLKRSPSPEAQAVADRALSLLPPSIAPPATAGARQVAFGAAGSVLGIVDRGRTLHLWSFDDRAPKKLGRPLPGISAFAFARQAATLAGLRTDGSLVVWNAAEGRQLAQFECSGPKTAVAINATGAVVAALCAGQLKVWKADPTWERAKAIPAPTPMGAWTLLALDEKGETVALGRNAGSEEFSTAYVAWVTPGAGQSAEPLGLDERLRAMTFLSRGLASALVLGGDSGKVWIQPAPPTVKESQGHGSEPQTLFQRSSPVIALASNEEGSQLIAGYRDGVARIWGSDQEAVARLVGEGPAISVALSNQTGQAFVVGRNLDAWNLASLNDSLPLEGALSARFYRSPPLLLYFTGVHYVLLDPRTRTELGRWQALSHSTFPIAVSPVGARVAVGIRESTLDSLGVSNFASLQISPPLWHKPIPGGSSRPVFSRDGKHLAAILGNAFLKGETVRPGMYVWDAVTGAEEVYRPVPEDLQPGARFFGFTPDDRGILFAFERGRLQSRHLGGREEEDLPGFPERGVTALAFSADGTLLATAASGAQVPTGDESESESTSQAAKIHVRHYPSGRGLSSFAQAGSIRSLVFSRDSRHLLSLSSDRSIVVWNTETGEEEARILPSVATLTATFTPEGDIAVVDRRQVVFHRWRPADLIREACRRLRPTRRKLTPEEWQRYVPGEPYAETCPPRP